MNMLQMQVEALTRLCVAEEEADRNQAREELRLLLAGSKTENRQADIEWEVRELLLELGAPDHLAGHPYLVQAILWAVEKPTIINSITLILYPRLAETFETTPSRVERAIRHVVEVTWDRGDLDILARYFGNTIHPEKGKPTNGEFIARIANVVRQRLRRAA